MFRNLRKDCFPLTFSLFLFVDDDEARQGHPIKNSTATTGTLLVCKHPLKNWCVSFKSEKAPLQEPTHFSYMAPFAARVTPNGLILISTQHPQRRGRAEATTTNHLNERAIRTIAKRLGSLFESKRETFCQASKLPLVCVCLCSRLAS